MLKILLMDSIFDVMKMMAMLGNKQYKRYLRKKYSVVLEDNINNEEMDLINYQEVQLLAKPWITIFETLVFLNQLGLIRAIYEILDFFEPLPMKEVDEVMEAIYDPEIRGLIIVGIALYYAFIRAEEIYSEVEANQIKSFGTRPLVGCIDAALLLFSNSYNRHKLSFKVEGLSLDDPLLLQRLPRYPTLAEFLYTSKYHEIYDVLSRNSGTEKHSSNDAYARKIAQLKIDRFNSDLRKDLRNPIYVDNIHTKFIIPAINLIALFKGYKNFLILLENIFDVMDAHFRYMNIDTVDSTQRSRPALFFKKRSLLKKASSNTVRIVSSEALRERTERTRLRHALTLQQSQQSQPELSPAAHHLRNPDEPSTQHRDLPQEFVSARTRKYSLDSEEPASQLLVFSQGDLKSRRDASSVTENNDKEEKLKRKQTILANYHKCNKALFRAILEGRVNSNTSTTDIINFANDLTLEVKPTDSGYLFFVYKQLCASFHRPHGKKDTINPNFFRALRDAFESVGITLNDLDELDNEISEQSCSASVLESIIYVMTTRPRPRVIQ